MAERASVVKLRIPPARKPTPHWDLTPWGAKPIRITGAPGLVRINDQLTLDLATGEVRRTT